MGDIAARDAFVEGIHQQTRASRHLIVTVLQAIEAQSSKRPARPKAVAEIVAWLRSLGDQGGYASEFADQIERTNFTAEVEHDTGASGCVTALSSEVLLAELVERGVLREVADTEFDEPMCQPLDDGSGGWWQFFTALPAEVYVRMLDTEEATDVR